MTILRMDNVGIVFDDLDAAVAFFVELGLELEGKMTVEGERSDRIVGLDGQRVDIAMMRTPDGHSKLELMSYQRPAMVSPEPKNAPPNTLGIRRLMFAVDDIDDTHRGTGCGNRTACLSRRVQRRHWPVRRRVLDGSQRSRRKRVLRDPCEVHAHRLGLTRR
jgi:catechol 2,3-dioxygenase-like lactoylglutathione lyase family enzyme